MEFVTDAGEQLFRADHTPVIILLPNRDAGGRVQRIDPAGNGQFERTNNGSDVMELGAT